MTNRKLIIGGNWKMNTDISSGIYLAGGLVDAIGTTSACDIAIYPPFPYLKAVDSVIDESSIKLGAQNLWHEDNGAYTGEISAEMLSDIGVTTVLIGHSERRHILMESDSLIALKVAKALSNHLQVVLCVGETLSERESGKTLSVVLSQVNNGLSRVPEDEMQHIVIAYEPVWAIGTGKTALPEDAQNVHAAIRSRVSELYNDAIASKIRIQYGGSVKPENAAALFACKDIDGALVGGAALSADSFVAIVEAACDA